MSSTANTKMEDFQTLGDSLSLAKIGDKPFTVIKVEDSNYTQGDESTPGIKITTKEHFLIDGINWNKFHTTRIAIVRFFKQDAVKTSINGGKPHGPVKCVTEKSVSGKSFFNLVDA